MPPSCGKRFESSTTAMPCGQKKKIRARVQSQIVTGPSAAITGTTLRFATATTKSNTRSHMPSARFRWTAGAVELSVPDRIASVEFRSDYRTAKRAGHSQDLKPDASFQHRAALVGRGGNFARLFLCGGQLRRDFGERSEMLIDV